MNFEPIIEKVFTVVISAAVGWLISAATKVSNTKLEKAIGELEKRVISPVVTRVERLETKADSFATRADVRELISDLKSSMEARQVELRVTMNGIFRELRDLRNRGWESSDDEN
jgi:hypothetical protein